MNDERRLPTAARNTREILTFKDMIRNFFHSVDICDAISAGTFVWFMEFKFSKISPGYNLQAMIVGFNKYGNRAKIDACRKTSDNDNCFLDKRKGCNSYFNP
uniref:Uncharacterized protein n=1 Tax=Glossina austeni TaxID=7395 RepID=A0A1A9V4G7_GLOAU